MDVLSEAGGLKEALVTILWFFFNIFNYKRHEIKVLKEYKNQIKKFEVRHDPFKKAFLDRFKDKIYKEPICYSL